MILKIPSLDINANVVFEKNNPTNVYDGTINIQILNNLLFFKKNYNISEIKELLSEKGDTTINLVVKNKNKRAHYCLDKNRKFDLSHFKALKTKIYVEKIIV